MILKKDMTAQQDDYKICFNRKYSVVFIFFFYGLFVYFFSLYRPLQWRKRVYGISFNRPLNNVSWRLLSGLKATS